jgi:hypothetical protein
VGATDQRSFAGPCFSGRCTDQAKQTAWSVAPSHVSFHSSTVTGSAGGPARAQLGPGRAATRSPSSDPDLQEPAQSAEDFLAPPPTRTKTGFRLSLRSGLRRRARPQQLADGIHDDFQLGLFQPERRVAGRSGCHGPAVVCWSVLFRTVHGPSQTDGVVRGALSRFLPLIDGHGLAFPLAQLQPAKT